MTAIVRLEDDGLAAEIAPALGGALLSFRAAGRDMLRPGAAAAVAADPRNAACFPCVPWFGRLHGGLDVEGAHWDLAPTLPACDPVHPLHGEGWRAAWSVSEQSAAALDCVLRRGGAGAGAFPFAYAARLRYELGAGRLLIALSVTNTGEGPMPAGLGLHPYFPREAETTLAFGAKGFWTPGDKGGGRDGARPADADFANGAALPDRTLDHSYTDFYGEAAIHCRGRRVTLAATAPILHVYAPAGAAFFCLEPVTHRPGAFGDARLAPGENLRLSMTLAPAS